MSEKDENDMGLFLGSVCLYRFRSSLFCYLITTAQLRFAVTPVRVVAVRETVLTVQGHYSKENAFTCRLPSSISAAPTPFSYLAGIHHFLHAYQYASLLVPYHRPSHTLSIHSSRPQRSPRTPQQTRKYHPHNRSTKRAIVRQQIRYHQPPKHHRRIV